MLIVRLTCLIRRFERVCARTRTRAKACAGTARVSSCPQVQNSSLIQCSGLFRYTTSCAYGSFSRMDEKESVHRQLDRTGVLSGLRWAVNAAVSRTLDDFSDDAGHNNTWSGCTRHILLCDRLDRAFACNRYSLVAGLDAAAGLDSVYAELTAHEKNHFPKVPPGLVRRADLNQSPGWLVQDSFRVLLASCRVGHIHMPAWSRRSATKQRVAQQPNPEEWALFGLETLGVATSLFSEQWPTFVLAHTLDPVLGKFEASLGRPRDDRNGGPAWQWCIDLLCGPDPAGVRPDLPPLASAPDAAPDAPVRLRGNRITGDSPQ